MVEISKRSIEEWNVKVGQFFQQVGLKYEEMESKRKNKLVEHLRMHNI